MKFSHHSEGPPCKRMETLLQQVADGSAKGWRRWYAVAHAARCARCGTFVDRLKLSIEALKNAKSKTISEDGAVERLRAKVHALSKDKETP